jgi:hypothetical protein
MVQVTPVGTKNVVVAYWHDPTTKRAHRPRFDIAGDAAATARNILASEQLYRAGILIDVVGQLLFLVVVLALYRLSEAVDRNQARLMIALIGTSIAAQFAGFALNVAPLILLSGEGYLAANC